MKTIEVPELNWDGDNEAYIPHIETSYSIYSQILVNCGRKCTYKLLYSGWNEEMWLGNAPTIEECKEYAELHLKNNYSRILEEYENN